MPRASSVPFRRQLANIWLRAGLVIKMLSGSQSRVSAGAQRFSVVSSCPELPCSEISVGRALCCRSVRGEMSGTQRGLLPRQQPGSGRVCFQKNAIPAFVFPDPLTVRPEPSLRCKTLKTEGLRALGAHPQPHNLPQEPEPGSDATTTLTGSQARGSPGAGPRGAAPPLPPAAGAALLPPVPEREAGGRLPRRLRQAPHLRPGAFAYSAAAAAMFAFQEKAAKTHAGERAAVRTPTAATQTQSREETRGRGQRLPEHPDATAPRLRPRRSQRGLDPSFLRLPAQSWRCLKAFLPLTTLLATLAPRGARQGSAPPPQRSPASRLAPCPPDGKIAAFGRKRRAQT